mgnify:CR=1 FL=1
MKFNGVCLITKNVKSLVAFYEKIFNKKANGDKNHADFGNVGLELAIFSIEGMKNMSPNFSTNIGHGCMTLMFEVENVDAEFKRLKGISVEILKEPENYPWGNRSFWFYDPDGNIVDFWSKI